MEINGWTGRHELIINDDELIDVIEALRAFGNNKAANILESYSCRVIAREVRPQAN